MIEIINKAIEIPANEYYKIETELFLKLKNINDKPAFLISILELSSWLGTSLRSGVWTYYEATEKEYVACTCKWLQQNAFDSEIYNMYSLGNHEYYEYNYDEYPQEWIDESEQIDEWIYENENNIISYIQDILKRNIDYFL